MTYDLAKVALCDAFLKRYLKSYLAASILVKSLEVLVDEVQADCSHSFKYDLNHIVTIHKIMQKMLTKFFGYKKFVYFQSMGKYLFNRFKCFQWKFDGKYPQIFKTRLAKYLTDPMLRYEPFYKEFVLGQSIFEGDDRFHEHLVSQLKKTNEVYFISIRQQGAHLGDCSSPLKQSSPLKVTRYKLLGREIPAPSFTSQFVLEHVN